MASEETGEVVLSRERVEEALLESEAMQRQLLENLPAGVVIVDPVTRVIERVNQHVATLFGAPKDQLVGHRCHSFLCPANEGACPVCDLGRAVDNSDRIMLRADGSSLSVMKSVKRIQLDGQEKLLECFVDISARKRAEDRLKESEERYRTQFAERVRIEEEKTRLEAKLQQTQKIESLALLAGGVAHDMNNVLGAILGLASANQKAHPEGSHAREAFATIAKAAVRGGAMVKGLLGLTRQSPAEERAVDLNGILREEASLLERTTLARVCLQMDLAPDLRPVLGDAGALAHAFMNLCVNAVDAMGDHGTLTLRTRNLDRDWVEVSVEDAGSGMSAEVLDRALDPFFTTKPLGKGTGLGLPIVYGTVKAHRGRMEIQSEPGMGTRVKLRFPACEPVSHLPAVTAEADPALGKPLQVLLVDDDELVQSSMKEVLEVLGHGVLGVLSGEDALAHLEAGFRPDVVILDMNMPGLGGGGTLPPLQRLCPAVPVILATGRADQAVLDLVAAHPLVSLLSKPFSIGELEEHLLNLQRR